MIRLNNAASILFCDICGEGFPAYYADLEDLQTLEREHKQCCFDDDADDDSDDKMFPLD